MTNLQKSQKGKLPEPLKSYGDQLEVTHTVDPPPIHDIMESVTSALNQAQKAKVERRHKCRVCNKQGCPHYKRVDMDTGEEFDLIMAPDLDGKR